MKNSDILSHRWSRPRWRQTYCPIHNLTCEGGRHNVFFFSWRYTYVLQWREQISIKVISLKSSALIFTLTTAGFTSLTRGFLFCCESRFSFLCLTILFGTSSFKETFSFVNLEKLCICIHMCVCVYGYIYIWKWERTLIQWVKLSLLKVIVNLKDISHGLLLLKRALGEHSWHPRTSVAWEIPMASHTLSRMRNIPRIGCFRLPVCVIKIQWNSKMLFLHAVFVLYLPRSCSFKQLSHCVFPRRIYDKMGQTMRLPVGQWSNVGLLRPVV